MARPASVVRRRRAASPAPAAVLGGKREPAAEPAVAKDEALAATPQPDDGAEGSAAAATGDNAGDGAVDSPALSSRLGMAASEAKLQQLAGQLRQRSSPCKRRRGGTEEEPRVPTKVATFGDLAKHPAWAYAADNDFIIGGYRKWYDLRGCVASLFELHNETVNVWSHLLGTALFLLLFLQLSADALAGAHVAHAPPPGGAVDPGVSLTSPASMWAELAEEEDEWWMWAEWWEDGTRNIRHTLHLPQSTAHGAGESQVVQQRHAGRWPMFVYAVCALICTGFSSLYHLFKAMGERVAARFLQLDFTGITVLVAGSFFPFMHYAFFKEPGWAMFYLVGECSLASVVAVATFTPWFARKQYRAYRFFMFMALAAWSVFPVVHLVWLHGIGGDNVMAWGPGIIVTVALYVSGGAIYALRVPERWSPGSFDTFGNSHQLFHTLIVAAAYQWHLTMTNLYTWRAESLLAENA